MFQLHIFMIFGLVLRLVLSQKGLLKSSVFTLLKQIHSLFAGIIWMQYWSCDTYQKTEWKVHINDIHRISAMRRDLCSSLFIYIPYIKISHPIRTMLFWSVSPAMSREWLSVVWYCQLLGYHTVQIWPEFLAHISNPLKHTCACRYIYSEGNVFLKTWFSTVAFHFIGIYITLHWI